MAEIINGLHAGMDVTVRVPEMTDKTTGKVFPAEEWVGVVRNPKALCMISRIPGVEVSHPEGGVAHVAADWVTPYVKPVRTPLTWENLYGWAERFVGKEHASAESVLVDLLLAHDFRSIGDYGIVELRETLLDFHKTGCRGYVEMERAELEKECRERFLDEDNCGMDLNDLEDLIETLGFAMEPEKGEEGDEQIIDVLSDSDKAAILEDFIVWSGGNHPRECDVEEVKRYVEGGADAKYDENAVEEFLEECRTSEEPRG